MSQADFSWVHHPTHQKIMRMLSYQARFVGGAIRNTLLSKPLDDFDIATPLLPQQVIQCLEQHHVSVIPTGLSHGTVTAILDKIPYEITTLRRDVETDGRHAKVSFTDSWKLDAERRDFTINALYVDAKGCIYDYFGGISDLKRGIIRFIGDPLQRIQEDYLRILRFFRIYAWYGCCLDEKSFRAACALKNHLQTLSQERITKELLKICSAADPWFTIRILNDHHFLKLLLNQNTSQTFFDILEIIEKRNDFSCDQLVRLLSVSGRSSFPTLSLSNIQKKNLSQSVLPLTLSQPDIINSVYAMGQKLTLCRIVVTVAREFALKGSKELLNLLAYYQEFLKKFQPPSFPIDGHDVQKMGICGKNIGKSLDRTRFWWIQQNCILSKEECLNYLETVQDVDEEKC